MKERPDAEAFGALALLGVEVFVKLPHLDSVAIEAFWVVVLEDAQGEAFEAALAWLPSWLEDAWAAS